jgi:hypothetical protein
MLPELNKQILKEVSAEVANELGTGHTQFLDNLLTQLKYQAALPQHIALGKA